MKTTLDLAQALIRNKSVTPADAGCQELLAQQLTSLGFSVERMPFGAVQNLWARVGTAEPLFVFAGHTDVVPSGDPAAWASEPFTPTIRDGRLFGRGSADMKGSIAAMMTAATRFLGRHAEPKGSIAFLITGDEEGPALDGTRKVLEVLNARHEKIDWCLVGEPSCADRLGDAVRNGRRGSLNGHLRLLGVQGHVAYPELACNPIHASGAIISALCAETWDQGNEFFPPTGFQIANVSAGTGVMNVIPGEMRIDFNFRFSTAITVEDIKQRVSALLDGFGCDYRLDWESAAEPFLTRSGDLLAALRRAIEQELSITPRLSTGGGTSDGRFIAPTGAEVAEFGLCNPSIHKVDENTRVEDLDRLALVYERVLDILVG